MKAYPISCLWHVEVRTLFYNNPINADEMMMAGHEAPFREAPSVGSLLMQASLLGELKAAFHCLAGLELSPWGL